MADGSFEERLILFTFVDKSLENFDDILIGPEPGSTVRVPVR